MSGTIEREFWRNRDIQTLSSFGKLLGAYVLTGPHHNMIGAYYLPSGYIAADLNWTDDRVRQCKSDLSQIEFCHWCAETQYVFVPNWIKFRPIKNPNQALARLSLVDGLPRAFSYWEQLLESFAEFGDHLPENWRDRFARFERAERRTRQTVLKGFENDSLTQERERERERDRERDKTPGARKTTSAPRDYPEEFEAVWKLYPERKPESNKKAAFRAYRARLNQGAREDEIAEGVIRYAAYCDADQIIGTRFVLAAKTFFGPDEHWKQPWEAGKTFTRSKLQESTKKIAEYIEREGLSEALFNG